MRSEINFKKTATRRTRAQAKEPEGNLWGQISHRLTNSAVLHEHLHDVSC